MSTMSHSRSSLCSLVYFLRDISNFRNTRETEILYLSSSLSSVLGKLCFSRTLPAISFFLWWCYFWLMLLPLITPLSSHMKQYLLYKGALRASTWTYEKGFWTTKEVSLPSVHITIALNLSFIYWSNNLLDSLFCMLFFFLSFSPLICWCGCHSWFRSFRRLIKLVPQLMFEVISMENTFISTVVSFMVMMIWKLASDFILYSLSFLCFLAVIILTLKIGIFSGLWKCLEHVYKSTVHKDLCLLAIKSFFCSTIAHTFCGVCAESASHKLWVLVLHRLSSIGNYILLSSFLMRCFSISFFILSKK